jgi:uncharacterized protein
MYRHKKIFNSILIGFLLFTLIGCQTNPQPQEVNHNVKKTIPLTINNQHFLVETAITKEEQITGLMHRTELADHKGMLFIYPEPKLQTFWMKNTKIPLDIIFIDSEKKIVNIETATPCKTNNCPTYKSLKAAKYVLEINADLATELNFNPLDQVYFNY